MIMASAFCGVNASYAAGKPAFGFTNVSQALMLHPLMAKFRVKEGRFIPEALQQRNAKDFEKSRKSLETKRKALVKKQKKLEAELQKADQDHSKAIAELNMKYNRQESSPTSDSDKYNKEKNKLESKFWVKRRELQKQIDHTKIELKKINDENELMHLTTQEETNQVYKIMLDDIYEAIDAVASHYKVDFVFNSSFSVERTAINPSFTPVNPMGEFLAKDFKRDAAEVLFKHGANGEAPLAMTLGYWSACQRYALRNLIDSRIDKMIIKGGLDMTPAVIDFVYQKYKVSPGHRDIIQEFMKKQAQ
jgi:hypothetical protein